MRKFIEKREKTMIKIVICSYIAFLILATANYYHILNMVGLK